MSGFGRILDDLNRAGIRYVLIGGIALIVTASYGPPEMSM